MARRWRSAGPLVLVSLILLGLPAAAFAQDTRPRFVIAVLGDSYASGEGSPDVHGRHSALGDLAALECVQLPFTPPPCFSETWWSPDSWFSDRDAVFPQQDDNGWQDAARRCHRSSKAPGPHAAMLIADRFPDVRVEVLDFACGGSTIGPACSPAVNPVDASCLVAQPDAGGLLIGWPGSEPPFGAPDLPPQMTALRDYASSTGRSGDIDAIVVNIGGNDAEFDDIVTDCLAILNPLDGDCTDNATVRRVRERLTPDATSPPFGNVEAPLSVRYSEMDAAIRGNGAGRPDEVYLTALPNPSRDAPPADISGNPQDFCDGSQTADDLYNNASRAESALIEGTLDGLNDAMQRAADRHSWVFMPQMFNAWRDHGICADAASFLRTNTDALRIQGDEGLPLPNFSPGLAHPNEAGYANRASIVADVVEEHVRMRFRAPTLNLIRIRPNSGFDISWNDPSPSHLKETRWEAELASPGSVQIIRSSGAGETDGFQEDAGNGRSWAVPRRGEFQVRVRGCRATPTGSYCGPYSNAVPVSTDVPGIPLDLRRTAAQPIDVTLDFPIRLAWSPGPNSRASTRYELVYGRFGGGPACGGTTLAGCTLLTDSGQLSTTATATRIALPRAGEWWFQVRACSAAGCSPLSGALVAQVNPRPQLPTSPLGTFGVRAPRRAAAGRRVRVDVAWRTPGRWTDLSRIDVAVRAGRRRLGTIRMAQDDGVLWLIRGRRRIFGHPDTRGRLTLGPLALDLRRSSIVRFGPRSRRVVLRLSVVPGRRLRHRRLVLGMSARNDRGRRQAERLAGVIRIR